MTRREALAILIRHAANDAAGVGCGIRTLPSYEEREKIAKAVLEVWRLVYDYECDNNALVGLGLPPIL